MQHTANFIGFLSAFAGCAFLAVFLLYPIPELAQMALVGFLFAMSAVEAGYRQGVSSRTKMAVWRILSLPLSAFAFWAAWAFSKQGDSWSARLEAVVGVAFLFEAAAGGSKIRYLPRDLRELRAYLTGLRQKFRERREWKKAMRRPK